MRKIEFFFKSHDGITMIRGMRYVPEGEIKAILQISHGMLEYIDRYENFAKFLTDKGILVTGNDHLGHGESVTDKSNWGYFAKGDANKIVLDDLHTTTELTKKAYPDKPYFLLGHSMGSFFAREYVCEYGNELNGAIVMGTGQQSRFALNCGIALIKGNMVFAGEKGNSSLIEYVAFGSYNKYIKPLRTHSDWLTRDEKVIDAYLKDPKCTYRFTLNGYLTMFKAMAKLTDEKFLDKAPKELPVFLFSGKEDPVGNYGKAVETVYNKMKETGMRNVEMKLYANDRHEILNELDKDQVYDDIYDWINKQLTLR